MVALKRKQEGKVFMLSYCPRIQKGEQGLKMRKERMNASYSHVGITNSLTDQSLQKCLSFETIMFNKPLLNFDCVLRPQR